VTKRKNPADKKKVGRETDYKPEFCQRACEYAVNGATDREIAELLGVTERTLYRWKHIYPEFCQSLEMGKEIPNKRVVQSLYRRAVGYSFDAVKIMAPGAGRRTPIIVPYVEHVPPDVGAAKLWLTNRDPENWREKSEVEHTGSVELLALAKSRRERAAKEG